MSKKEITKDIYTFEMDILGKSQSLTDVTSIIEQFKNGSLALTFDKTNPIACKYYGKWEEMQVEFWTNQYKKIAKELRDENEKLIKWLDKQEESVKNEQ